MKTPARPPSPSTRPARTMATTKATTMIPIAREPGLGLSTAGTAAALSGSLVGRGQGQRVQPA